MEKVKKFPWLYLVIYDHFPCSVYSVAWRALAFVVCMSRDDLFDCKKLKVVRYRLANSNDVVTLREDVTDSFIRSAEKY